MWPSRREAVLTAFAFAAAEREQAPMDLIKAFSSSKDD